MDIGENRHALDVETRLFSETDRLVDYIASTQKKDSYNTRLLEWNEDSLDQYRKNPVVLYMHNPTMPPVGRTVALDFDNDGNMRARIQYAPKSVYAFADTLYKLTRDGYLKGLSVGFGKPRMERNDDLDCMDYYDIHLRELSCVPLPGNVDSLATAVRTGMIPKEHQQLMAINYAMTADHIDGVADLSRLGKDVVEWMNDYDSSLCRSFDEEPVVEPDNEEPEKEDPIVIRQDTDDAPATVPDTEPVEDDRLRVASVGALDTIAAAVGFDIDDLDTVEGIKRLCIAVQGACTRTGAPLSKTSITKLGGVIDTLVGLRDIAVSGKEPVEPVVEPVKEEVPVDRNERLDKVEADLDMITRRLLSKDRVDSARALMGAAHEDKNHDYLEQILKRVSG